MTLKTNPLVAMIEESILLKDSAQRILSRELSGPSLTRLEGLVLVSIVGADHPQTAPQIGRTLGNSRQVIGRAAKRLEELGFVRKLHNPDHKTAPLLEPTKEGIKYEKKLSSTFDEIVDGIVSGRDLKKCEQITNDIRRLRALLEAYEGQQNFTD
ncbi:MarR family winged helix-turn-helix transcriptional regulator [Haliea sp. E17]|uniref:MarR family winged helix-turn-helix transcriptional regulator n=1 Tax=Haliea sp. E17 TaxID=3401576 RepID=UPI003AAF5538